MRGLCVLACSFALVAPLGAQTTTMPATGAEISVKTGSQLIAALRDRRPEARAAANAAIAKADPALVEDLLRMAGSPRKREANLRLIVRMGRKTIPTLLALLGDEAEAPEAGACLVQLVTPRDAALIPELLDCTRSRPLASGNCARALVQVAGPEAAPHARALGACAADRGSEARPYCAAALVRLGAKSAPATESLAKALSDPLPTMRAQAAKALGAVGPGAAKAVPALRAALKDPVPEVRAEARTALKRVGA